jgi:hypothetical protein
MQNVKSEQEVINLSKAKWRWMSERKTDSLVYVKQSGTWTLASLSFTRLLTP